VRVPHAPTPALLERARAGDARALEELLEQHQAQVYRFGLRMCRDPEDAKDVLQDTLFAMARSVRDFRGASSISTWLYSIARSFCIKKRRVGKFAPAPRDVRSLDTESAAGAIAAGLADPARRPDEVLAALEVERALEQAIDALDPMYREVLLLRDAEGLSAPEVAEVLGIGVPAVKSRLHRARLSVRAHVAPLLGIPDQPTSPSAASAPPPAASATPSATPPPAASSSRPCPDVLMRFSQYLEGDIEPAVCAEMERHLDECPRCRGACASLKRTVALCRTSASGVEVPAPVQKSVKVALKDLLSRT
jgi:RNA polymerase sigma-70 factor (ECF subfamily)